VLWLKVFWGGRYASQLRCTRHSSVQSSPGTHWELSGSVASPHTWAVTQLGGLPSGFPWKILTFLAHEMETSSLVPPLRQLGPPPGHHGRASSAASHVARTAWRPAHLLLPSLPLHPTQSARAAPGQFLEINEDPSQR
jgi:hypothetical protein